MRILYALVAEEHYHGVKDKDKIMKANEAPEKIYLYPYSTDGIYEVETKPLEWTIEYIRTDAFIEKADKFINSFFHPGDTELKKVILDEFHKYMKGE